MCLAQADGRLAYADHLGLICHYSNGRSVRVWWHMVYARDKSGTVGDGL